jgi:membrane protein
MTMRWGAVNFFKNAGEMARATVFPADRVDSRRRFLAIYLLRLFFLVGRRVWKDNCPRQAAALAYQTVLSLVPLLAVTVSFATWLDLVEYQTYLTRFAAQHLMPEAAEALTDYVIEAAGGVKIRALGIMGAVGLVALAMTLLFTIEGVINEIFRCSRKRPIFKRLIVAILLLTLGPLAAGLSIYFTGKFVIIPGLFSTIKPLLSTVLGLFAFYWLLPTTRVQVRHALVAAIVTGILLEALKVGFAFYVTQIGDTLSYLYGAFAILPLAMVWIYFAWLIFLFGAELNAALHEVKQHDRLSDE